MIKDVFYVVLFVACVPVAFAALVWWVSIIPWPQF